MFSFYKNYFLIFNRVILVFYSCTFMITSDIFVVNFCIYLDKNYFIYFAFLLGYL